MKIISWNVNGIRSVQSKGFAETLARLNADCILLQETKAQAEQIDKALEGIDSYHIYSNCAERKGYAGVTLLTRQAPLQIINDIGIVEHDREGRVMVAEFEHFFLLNVYVPNSGEELARLDYRKTWDTEFLAYCQQLQSKNRSSSAAISMSHTRKSISPVRSRITINRQVTPRSKSTVLAVLSTPDWSIPSDISIRIPLLIVGGVSELGPGQEMSVGGSITC